MAKMAVVVSVRTVSVHAENSLPHFVKSGQREHFNNRSYTNVKIFTLMAHELSTVIKKHDPHLNYRNCTKPSLTTPPPPTPSLFHVIHLHMASVFWDAEGILSINYLENGKTITGEYYSNFFNQTGKNS
jgi:hypothetical protein